MKPKFKFINVAVRLILAFAVLSYRDYKKQQFNETTNA